MALGDPSLVRRIKGGRSLRLRTAPDRAREGGAIGRQGAGRPRGKDGVRGVRQMAHPSFRLGRPTSPVRKGGPTPEGPLRWARIGIGGPSSPAGLKPTADEIRRILPFGSPKRGRVARPNEAQRGRRRVVEVDPPHGGTDARVPRQGRWRGSVAAPASRVHGRLGIAGLHSAAGRASRGPLNGFPGARAGVLRHRIGGGRRRLSDTQA